jgi:hypothetical protein
MSEAERVLALYLQAITTSADVARVVAPTIEAARRELALEKRSPRRNLKRERKSPPTIHGGDR